MQKPLTLLTLALIWAAIAVWPDGPELVKVSGVAIVAALLLPTLRTSSGSVSPQLWAMCWISAIISAMLALEPGTALIGSQVRAQGLLLALSCLVLASAAAAVPAADRQRLYRRASALGSVVSVYALMQRTGLDPLSWTDQTEARTAATLGNANMLASWLILLLPMTALQIRAGASRLWILPLVLQVAALLVTGSRGALLALAIAAFVLWLLRARPALSSLLWVTLGIALLGVGLAALRPASLQDRAYLWQTAARAVLRPAAVLDANAIAEPRAAARFWFGYGPDQQLTALASARVGSAGERTHAQGLSADRAHQGLLDLFLENGLLGLLLLSCLFWVIARRLWRALGASCSQQGAEATALALALGAWLLNQQWSFALTGDRTLAWVWIGCALALTATDDSMADPKPVLAAPRSAWRALGPTRYLVSSGFVLAALAAAGMLPQPLGQRLAPAAAAESEFVAGQQHYLRALSAEPGATAATMIAAAQAFERACALQPYDRDAAFAAASAWVEAAAAGADADALVRARTRLQQLQRSAAGDPRIPSVAARIDQVGAQLPR